ncbi:predicted protein [Pyrenophora tritici-repentis Pt-1C-BFP]|uniref:Uncharacterized protein n=1 Tax=Pyrenophora tritici-repentis (strain Pt-1C-BFP) TaxID=426418 RepID=B2WEW0_PYRTR|nr:uncharacterized protein PTRG_08683 [Pyrenophora tritici-repentis Pt-1C-BFP]EDU51602.1 predicted protein [Pyrenophora tritici-repentis Pt-1C-BFP]
MGLGVESGVVIVEFEMRGVEVGHGVDGLGVDDAGVSELGGGQLEVGAGAGSGLTTVVVVSWVTVFSGLTTSTVFVVATVEVAAGGA